MSSDLIIICSIVVVTILYTIVKYIKDKNRNKDRDIAYWNCGKTQFKED